MAHTENTIQNRKNKHLSPFERGQIAALHNAGHSNRDIARRLGRAHQTIANELQRGTTTQLKTGRTPYTAYFAETGQAVYERNRINCGAKSKLLVAIEFIDFACEKIMDQGWSPDAVVGFANKQTDWKDKPMVSTKTLYNYIDLDLLSVRNIDLPMKTRRNTKTKRVRKNSRILGMSIAERPPEIEDRAEFGHWEIDTVEGKKSDDNALLTLVERKTRNYYAILLDDQDHDSVDYAMNQLQQDFGELFPQVFKTITSDNGSEFSNLAWVYKMSRMSISHALTPLMKEVPTSDTMVFSDDISRKEKRFLITLQKPSNVFIRHLIIYQERFWTTNSQLFCLNKS